MINVDKLFEVYERIRHIYFASSEWDYNNLMAAYAEVVAISEMRTPKYSESKVTGYFLSEISSFKYKLAEVLSYPSTNVFSIYNHRPKTRSRSRGDVYRHFDYEFFVKNILSVGDKPASWEEVDDIDGIFNSHFVSVLKEIDDEFDEAEIIYYKENYFEMKANGGQFWSYNWVNWKEEA